MCDEDGAIGIFDSGVGGLTVFRALRQRLPREPVIYLGDTARVPYGTKSSDTVIRYARACTRILLERHVKLLVAACNTASACAVDVLRGELDVPVLGVIEPGARAAVLSSRTRRIGVIGTAGTIASGAYPRAIARLDPEAQVYCRPCPLFVPLAEEGWLEGAVPRTVAQTYLGEMIAHDIDTLVLGCTHYPLLAPVIAQTMGQAVTLIDSAQSTAEAVAETLEAAGSVRRAADTPKDQFLVSDAPEGFARTGSRFLGAELEHVEWLDF
jgi:glutamate racemase